MKHKISQAVTQGTWGLSVGLSLWLTVVPVPTHADASLQTAQLLQLFSAGCQSQGQWTQAAQGYANGLAQTLKSLAADPDCRTLNGALSQVQNISNAFNALSQDQNQKQIMSLQQQQEELFILMSQTTDATKMDSLLTQFQSVEVQLAQYQANSSSDHHFQNQQHEGRTLQTLVSGTNILLQQAVQNEVCLDKNPGVLAGLVGLAGSVQSVALTGGSSLIVAAGADIMNSAIDQSRNLRLAKRINNMASAVTASAYQCVLETLSNQWCASEDTLQILRLKGNAITNSSNPSTIQQGITLLDKDQHIFLNWLESIRSGTDPANQATATRQALALDRDKQVRAGRVNGLGTIAEFQHLFDQPGLTDEGRWNVEVQVVSSITSAFNSNGICILPPCATTPFSDVFGSSATEVAAWYLVGVADSQIPRDTNGLRKTLSSFAWKDIPTAVGNPAFKPDLGFVKAKMGDWVNLARNRVNTELSLVLNLDPLKLIVNAATPNLDETSPFASLQKIITFLKTQTSRDSVTGSFKTIYDDTINRLQTIADNIQTVLNSQSPAGDTSIPTAAIAEIYRAAVLDNGVGFVGDRLQWALRLTLNHLLISGHSGVPASQAAALLASNDVIAQLESVAPGADLNLIARDIQNSQVIIEKTLGNFTDGFGKGLARAIFDYSSQASALGEDGTGSSQQAIAEMCLKLLASPRWPRAINPQICHGRSLSSLFKEGPESAVFTTDLMQASYKDRACTFRDYNRQNRLYQLFQNRNHSN